MRRCKVPEIPQEIVVRLREAIDATRRQLDIIDSTVSMYEPLNVLRLLGAERGRVEPEQPAVEPKKGKGKRKPHVRLTDGQKREIFLLIGAGLRNKDIASRYGVSSALISQMRCGRVHSEFRPEGV